MEKPLLSKQKMIRVMIFLLFITSCTKTKFDNEPLIDSESIIKKEAVEKAKKFSDSIGEPICFLSYHNSATKSNDLKRLSPQWDSSFIIETPYNTTIEVPLENSVFSKTNLKEITNGKIIKDTTLSITSRLIVQYNNKTQNYSQFVVTKIWTGNQDLPDFNHNSINDFKYNSLTFIYDTKGSLLSKYESRNNKLYPLSIANDSLGKNYSEINVLGTRVARAAQLECLICGLLFPSGTENCSRCESMLFPDADIGNDPNRMANMIVSSMRDAISNGVWRHNKDRVTYGICYDKIIEIIRFPDPSYPYSNMFDDLKFHSEGFQNKNYDECGHVYSDYEYTDWQDFMRFVRVAMAEYVYSLCEGCTHGESGSSGGGGTGGGSGTDPNPVKCSNCGSYSCRGCVNVNIHETCPYCELCIHTKIERKPTRSVEHEETSLCSLCPNPEKHKKAYDIECTIDRSPKELTNAKDKFASFVANGWDCMLTAKAVLDNFGLNGSYGSSSAVFQITIDTGEVYHPTLNPDKYVFREALNCIDIHLNNDRPIIVGVTHNFNGNETNIDGTDHFIVIIGRGYDENMGSYYTYMETATDKDYKGYNPTNNRLYYNPTVGILTDSESCEGNFYYVTNIRPNDGKEYDTTPLKSTF